MKAPFLSLYHGDMPQLIEYVEHEKINIVDEHHCSLLHHAIRLGANEAFQLLMNNYIDLDIRDDQGNTCYHYAVLHNRLNYLRVMFLRGGNPMQRNKEGRTPLYLACLYGKEQIIDLYLEKYQLDMGEKDQLEQTVCMAFVLSGRMDLLEKYGNYMKWLEEPNYLGETPLMLAVKQEDIKMVDFILSKKVFVNQKNHLGESAVFYAVRKRNKPLFKALLHFGAFLDFKNHFGETIFSLSKEDMKEYICECSSKEPYSSYKRTYPLHDAIYKEDAKEIFKYMHLPYAFLEDPFGYTPLKLAQKYKCKDTTQALKELEKKVKIQTFKTKL